MTWGVSLSGNRAVRKMLKSVNIEMDGSTVYVVGPTANYAIYVDQGTSRMNARPFVKPAVERVQSNIGSTLSQNLTGDLTGASEDEILRTIAVAVEFEMKKIITQKGAVDTGNMRASVTIERV